MADRCQFRVFSGRRDDMRGHLCGKPVKSGDKCAIHMPEAIAKRNADRDAEYDRRASAIREKVRKEKAAYDALAQLPKLQRDNKAPLEALKTHVDCCPDCVVRLMAGNDKGYCGKCRKSKAAIQQAEGAE